MKRKNFAAVAAALMLSAGISTTGNAATFTFDGFIDPLAVGFQPLAPAAVQFGGLFAGGRPGQVGLVNSPFGGLDNGGPFIVGNLITLTAYSGMDCCRVIIKGFDFAAASPEAVGATFLYRATSGQAVTAEHQIVLGASFQRLELPRHASLGGGIYMLNDRFQTTALVAIDNVEFEVYPGPVPEPATWSLMILGFGAAGVGLRRRRHVQA